MLNRGFRVMAAGLAMAALLSAAWTECLCAAAKASGSGWCADCKMGYAFGQKTRSRSVYDTLQGRLMSEEDMKKCDCAACKTAYAKDGACEACHVRFVHHTMYSSNVAAALAVGEPVGKDTAMCAKCKAAVEKNGLEKMAQQSGWCDGCKAGFVAGRKYATKEAFDAAKKALGLVRSAIEAADHCEGCAVAILTDGKCDDCKVSFKNGEMVKAKP